MKGVGHGGQDDKEVAIGPGDLPKFCMGCDVEFQEGEVGRFLDDQLAFRVHDTVVCVQKARLRLG